MVRNVNSGGGALVAKLCPSFAIPCTVACQVPLSMGFPRQGYWSGLPFPPLGGRFFFFKSLRHCKETCLFSKCQEKRLGVSKWESGIFNSQKASVWGEII